MNQSKFGDPHGGHIPGILLWQASKMWQQQLNISLASLHLSSTSGAILTNILYFDQQSRTVAQKEIAAASKVDVMTTSQAIRTLEKKGFVVRHESEADKRAYAVVLTPAGREAASQVIERFIAAHRVFFKTLDVADRREAFVKDLDEIITMNAADEVNIKNGGEE